MVPTPDSRTPLPTDTRIGQWRLVAPLKAGAFGCVYEAVLAEEPHSPTFALKLARHAGDARFEREAWLLSHLHHVGVPRLHGAGTYFDSYGRPFPYLVMQYVAGEELYDWPVRHRLTTRAVLKLMAQVARALEATHQLGVHRDVKGDNVRVGVDGHAVLLDFGACWYPGAHPLTDGAVPPGTEPYRSPQMVRFRHKHRYERGARYQFVPEDDLYALGVTGYYLVTGRLPELITDPAFADDTWRDPPGRRMPASARATILPEADAIIWRLLSEDPLARGSAKEIAEALEKAAVSLGPEADELIVPTTFYQKTESPSDEGPPRSRRERRRARLRKALLPPLASLGIALAVVGLFALLPTLLAYVGGNEIQGDEGQVDVGSKALSSASPFEEEERHRSARAMSAKMPDTPLQGQKRPPCDPRGEVEINEGCWANNPLPPPCPRQWYEWKDSCYLPALISASERPPTSKDP